MLNEDERITSSVYFEGIVSVRTVIENMEKRQNDGAYFNDRKVEMVYITAQRKEKYPKEYAWLSARGSELYFEITEVEESFLSEHTTGNSHGGIIAKCGERTLPGYVGAGKDGTRFGVMLDGIEDPYNFGYAIRSLYAAGCDFIIVPERNWMSASGIVCRSSAGASELIPIFTANAEDAVLETAKNGFRIVCADLRESVPMMEADLRYPIFLVVGGEKRGISRSILDKSDVRIRIEYGRPFGASLSAASAATIAAFEIFRQNKNKI